MYTIEDYYAMPEERRVELIDGVFYDMASPSFVHQMIQGCVFTAICFNSRIPVGIYQGDLEIDFAEIKKEVESLY